MGKIRAKLFERLAADSHLRAIDEVKSKVASITAGSGSEQQKQTAIKAFLDSPHRSAIRGQAVERTSWRGADLNERSQVGLFKILMIRLRNYMAIHYRDGSEKGKPQYPGEAVAAVTLQLELRDFSLSHEEDPNHTKKLEGKYRKRRVDNPAILESPYDDDVSRQLILDLQESGLLNCG